ncbi:hypothetical protein EC991_002023 [Linnemannia zychae]|nr:hypothetical protein EC991_002023 [Linnemannia zychae]
MNLIPPTNMPLSGLTAVQYVDTIVNQPLSPRLNTDSKADIRRPSLSQFQICTVFAHLEEALWLGAGMSLLQWTWYLFRSLRRKLGVVSSHLMEVVVENEPTSRSCRGYGGVESDMAAGYSFTRSIRSLADIWALMPTFIVVPLAIIGLVLKTCIRSACCCCFSTTNDTPISEHNRAVMEEEIQQKMKAKNVEDVFEAWPKWPKYIEDDPTAARAVESASEQLCEIQIHSPTDIAPSSHSTAFVSEPPNLATKLGVARLDLNDTHEENYSYDITKQRIRYHRNSWSFKFRVFLAVHHQLLSDIVVCIVIPFFAFLLLFFVPAQNRAYDIYPSRGGCRVSSNGALNDWVRMVVLQALLSLIAALGLLFSILSILQFKKQHGALSFKMKSLSPSAAVLRLYKSTEIVKNILLFCVGMNAVQFLGRIVYIVLRISKHDPSFNTVRQVNRQPLFRPADHNQDQDVALVILAMLLVGGTALSTFWKSLRNWGLLLCCFGGSFAKNDEYEEAACSYPYPKVVEGINTTLNGTFGAPSQAARTDSYAKNDELEETEIERLERLPGLRVGIVEPSMVISIGNERCMNNLSEELRECELLPPFTWYDEAQSDPQTQQSSSISSLLPIKISDASPSTKIESGQISSKLKQVARPSEDLGRSASASSSSSSSSSGSTWLSSVPINADGALTAIPSTSSASFSPPLPSQPSPGVFLPSFPPPALLATIKPKLSKTSLRVFHSNNSTPELAYTKGPLPTVPNQFLPVARAKGQQSHSITGPPPPPTPPPLPVRKAATKAPSHLVQTNKAAQVGGWTTPTSRDNQTVSLTAVGKSYESTKIVDSEKEYPTAPSTPTTAAAAITAILKESRLDFDYNYSDDDDICELETMGSISLEGLVFDDPSADYDAIHQTMMLPLDDRAMLENIVHHALKSSTPSVSSPLHRIPSPKRVSAATTMYSRNTSTSCFYSSYNRRSSSRTRRRPSVVQPSNFSPYGRGYGYTSRMSTSSRRSRRSEDMRHAHALAHPCFHLVSRGINAVDLYGEGEGDGEDGGESIIRTPVEFGRRSRTSHHYYHRKSSGALNFLAHPHTYPYIYPRSGLSPTIKGNYLGMNRSSGSINSTIFENEHARPDSPIDPMDS